MTTPNEENPFADFISEQYNDGEPLPLDPKREPPTSGGNVEETRDEDAGNEDEPREDRDVPDEDANEGDAGYEEGDEELPDDDDEEQSEEDKRVTEKAKAMAKNMAKGRIGQLTKQLARMRAEIDEIKQPKQAAPGGVVDVKKAAQERLASDPNAPKKPDISKYPLGEFDDAYKDDYYDYREARKAYLEKAEAELADEQTASAEAASEVAEFSAKLTEWRADDGKVKGFKEALAAAEAQEFPISFPLAQQIVDSDVGREIAVHLHQNPKLAAELFALPVGKQLVRFGKLEDKFQAEREAAIAKANKPSKAPPPIDRVRGSGGKFGVSPDTENFEDFERMANAKRK